MRLALAALAPLVVSACSGASRPGPPTTGHGSGTPIADSGPIGTANPIVIEASDPSGRWVVACQARVDTDGDGVVAVHLGMHGDTYGDAMKPYLIVGGGAGEAIDAFVDQTRDGSRLAVIAGGALVVVDGATGARTTIADADLRDDDYPTLGPRAAAFAGADRLVFMRHRAKGDVVVTRALPGGAEIEAAVPGVLWRIEPDAGGAWAQAITVRTDSDSSGGLEWPAQQTSLSSRGCRGPIGSYSSFGASGDEPDVLWVALDGSGVVDDATVVSVAGPGLVKVTADQALALGDQTVLPAGCDPTVRATSADPPRILAGCGATATGKTRLMLVGPGVKQDLGVEVDRTEDIRRLAPGDRLACVDNNLCVDVVTGAVRTGELVYADADRVLLRRDDHYVVVDGTGVETALAPIAEGYPTSAAGPVLAIGKTIVDLASASIRGRVDGEIAAVDRTGRVLVTRATADDTPGPDLAGGPAIWTTPK